MMNGGKLIVKDRGAKRKETRRLFEQARKHYVEKYGDEYTFLGYWFEVSKGAWESGKIEVGILCNTV